MATIEPAATNVYAVEDHVISCNLSGIPAQITGVIWTPLTTETGGYTVDDGLFDSATNSQVSTLTISAYNLVELRSFAESHTFTCKIFVGFINKTVADNQIITIFNPGTNSLFSNNKYQNNSNNLSSILLFSSVHDIPSS